LSAPFARLGVPRARLAHPVLRPFARWEKTSKTSVGPCGKQHGWPADAEALLRLKNSDRLIEPILTMGKVSRPGGCGLIACPKVKLSPNVSSHKTPPKLLRLVVVPA